MYPARRSGLKSPQRQAQCLQTLPQCTARQGTVWAALIGNRSNVNSTVQIRSSGNNGSLYGILCPQCGDNAADSTIFHQNFCDFRLFDIQVFGLFANLLHIIMIPNTVCLHPKAVDSWSFSSVQHTALQEAGIGCLTHFTAEGINFPYQVPFCRSADGRIAGHVGNLV